MLVQNTQNRVVYHSLVMSYFCPGFSYWDESQSGVDINQELQLLAAESDAGEARENGNQMDEN